MPSAKHLTGGGPGATGAGAPPVPLLRAVVAIAAGAALSCAAPPGPPPVPARTLLEGVTYSEFAGATLARRIHAEQLMVLPKRFGMFQVSALSELVLTRARVEVFEPAPGAGGAEGHRTPAALDVVVPSQGLAGLGLAEVRHLAGATFYDLEVVIARGGTPVARVRAAHAHADPRSGNLVLRDARLEHLPSGRVVRAARATWRRTTGDFAIPGDYAMDEGGRTRTGRGLLVDGDIVARSP